MVQVPGRDLATQGGRRTRTCTRTCTIHVRVRVRVHSSLRYVQYIHVACVQSYVYMYSAFTRKMSMYSTVIVQSCRQLGFTLNYDRSFDICSHHAFSPGMGIVGHLSTVNVCDILNIFWLG